MLAKLNLLSTAVQFTLTIGFLPHSRITNPLETEGSNSNVNLKFSDRSNFRLNFSISRGKMQTHARTHTHTRMQTHAHTHTHILMHENVLFQKVKYEVQ